MRINRILKKIVLDSLVEYEKKNKYKRFIWRFVSTFLVFIIGFWSSWIISNKFHNKSVYEEKEKLINNAVYEVKLNTNLNVHNYYIDSVEYKKNKRLYNYLQTSSLNELYENIYIFKIDDTTFRTQFRDTVYRCKVIVEIFNNSIRMRNDIILGYSIKDWEFDDIIAGSYKNTVLPSLRGFVDFVEHNMENLLK